MTWRFVGKDPSSAVSPRIQKLFEDAWAAAPQGYLEENTVEMLPRRPVIEACRLCGAMTRLTKEHIPPKGSGNIQTSRLYSFDDWLLRNSLDDLRGGKHQQGGVFGYTLCGSCNSYTGTHYGTEYQKWVQIASEVLNGLPHPVVLDHIKRTQSLNQKFVAGSGDDGGMCPGAFVRQVMSCICTLSGTWNLAERHPEIRRIILEQSTEVLPPELKLGLGLYFGPRSRMIGPQLQVEPDKGEWRWLIELAYLPFAFLCVIASNVKEPQVGFVMNNWTLVKPTDRKRVEGIVRVGFGWSSYPGDYRSSCAISAEQ